MTEEQAEAFAERLTRIWNVEVDTWSLGVGGGLTNIPLFDAFCVPLSGEVEIQVAVTWGATTRHFLYTTDSEKAFCIVTMKTG